VRASSRRSSRGCRPSALGDALFARFGSDEQGRPTKEGHLWYLRSLADAYRGRLPGRLPGELDRTLDELETLVRPDPDAPLHVRPADAVPDAVDGIAFRLVEGRLLAFARKATPRGG